MLEGVKVSSKNATVILQHVASLYKPTNHCYGDSIFSSINRTYDCPMKNDELLNYATRNAERFLLRLPAGMRNRIEEAAQLNGRSMNSEILACINAQFNQASDHAFLMRAAKKVEHSIDEINARIARIEEALKRV